MFFAPVNASFATFDVLVVTFNLWFFAEKVAGHPCQLWDTTKRRRPIKRN